MLKKAICLLIAGLLAFVAVSVFASADTSKESSCICSNPAPKPSGYVTHDPIRINSDAEFTAQFTINRTIYNLEINGSGYGYCIYIGNCSLPFTIKNCYLHNAYGSYSMPYFSNSAISIYTSHNGTIENNIVTKSGSGVMLHSSSMNHVKHNSASWNEEKGIYLNSSSNNQIAYNNASNTSGFGILLESSSFNLISNNNASGNNYDGIGLEMLNNGNTISNNTVNGDGFGISLYESDGNQIIDNNASISAYYGIYLDISSFNQLTRNTVCCNTYEGFVIDYSNNNSINDNNVIQNLRWGFEVAFSQNNTFSNNKLINNGGYGFNIHSQSSNNNITDNVVRGNQMGGLFIADNSDNGSIANNSICANKHVGITVLSSDNTRINGNVISNHSDEGIVFETSKNNIITRNSIEGDYGGIAFWSSSDNNTIEYNDITACLYAGIYMEPSNNNRIINNTISGNALGIELHGSNTTIAYNNITGNTGYGIYTDSVFNRIHHNNFINNNGSGSAFNPLHIQAFDGTGTNFWNSSYPDGGNYWADWTSPDAKKGPNQDKTGSDGIVDSPYSLDGSAGAKDKYPFANRLDFFHLKITSSAPFQASSGMKVNVTAHVEDNVTHIPVAGARVVFTPTLKLLNNQTAFTDANGNTTVTYLIPAASSGTGFDVNCTIFVNASMPGYKTDTSLVVILLHIDGPPPIPESPATAIIIFIFLLAGIATRRNMKV